MGAAATHSLRAEIMRHLLILTCLLFGTGATAEEGDFDFNGLIAKKALRDYKKALVEDKKAIELRRKKLDEEADSLAKTTRDAFVENLTKALKQSMQAGNLEEANKIDAAIKALKKGASPAGASVAGSKDKKKAKKSKARIPRNAVKYKGHHYKLFDIQGPHGVAMKKAESMGGHLVRIQGPDEQQVVAKLANSGRLSNYWIDGSDELSEGRWLFSDDKPMRTFFWGGRPSNSNGNEHHLEIRQDVGWKWNDIPSGAVNGFICEWDE